MKTLLGVLTLIFLVALILSSYSITSYSGSQDVTTTIAIPSNKSFTLNIDFKVLNYTTLKSSLEISLGNESIIKLYLNEHVTNLLPGFYLFNNSKVTSKELMLEANKWYSIVINYNYTINKLVMYLKTLNSSFIATDIRHVLTLFNQGLAFSGDNWFFTETTTICKLSRNLSKIIKCNFDPIPGFLKEKEYFHLGDLDYYDDLLVIPVEKTKYVKPAVIAIYDSNTLKLLNYSYTSQDHMPWIALDNNGYIYTSEYSPVTEIYIYHIKQVGFGNYIKPIKVIKLKKSLKNIQGGVVVKNGLLALTSDDGDHIYFINISTGDIIGKVRLPGLYEMEGIEYVKEDNKEFFYVLFNTQGLGKNVLYRYHRIDSEERLSLFNVSCKSLTTIRIVYDNKTIRLGNMIVTTPSPRGEARPSHNYMLIVTLVIAIALIITLMLVRKIK